jgi:small subunit ribosomal protein S9
MRPILNASLTTSRYRQITTLLNQLNDYRRIAFTAGYDELAVGIEGVTEVFERANKEAFLARGKRKPVKFDQYGRTYTLGKRKTSAARVWVIPTKRQELMAAAPASSSNSPQTDAEAADALLGLASQSVVTIPTSTVLVNNIPLAEYFSVPADRERVIRPFKIAGVLGGYNVFALVRGGGTTGQSSAVALGIAKGIAAHEPAVEAVLRKGEPFFYCLFICQLSIFLAKLMRRDPRMVERKKTGMAKARKRVRPRCQCSRLLLTNDLAQYTWVKR